MQKPPQNATGQRTLRPVAAMHGIADKLPPVLCLPNKPYKWLIPPP